MDRTEAQRQLVILERQVTNLSKELGSLSNAARELAASTQTLGQADLRRWAKELQLNLDWSWEELNRPRSSKES